MFLGKKLAGLAIICLLGFALTARSAEKKEKPGDEKVGAGTLRYVKSSYLSGLKSAGFKPKDLEVYSSGRRRKTT